MFDVLSESAGQRVCLTHQEERFFFEYLRVAGDRSPLDCARDIASTLGSKSPDQILSFYQYTIDLIYKDKTNLAKANNKKTHKILTKFYDTRVAPARKKQHNGGCVSDKSPDGSKKDCAAIGYHLNEKDCFGGKILANETDIGSQLQGAPFLEILFVPFEEDLANTLASSGCDPCPRLKFGHNEKIIAIIHKLQETWNTALGKLGSGGLRLKAPDDSHPAFKACAWGDPSTSKDLTLFELMNALRIASPATLGYTWEHQFPQTASPQEAAIYYKDRFKRRSPVAAQEKKRSERDENRGDVVNSDSISLAVFSSPKGQQAEDSGLTGKKNGAILPAKSNQALFESKKLFKASSSQRKKRKDLSTGKNGKDEEVTRPEQILRNAWAQYAGAIKQRHDYNLMNGKYHQNYTTASFRQNPSPPEPIELTDREKSILDFIRKDESNFAVAFESLKGICSPQGKASVQTPASKKKKNGTNDDEIDALAGLSPPSSFKLPPEFHRVSGQSSTPIRSLCGIFDSCQPLSPGKLKNKSDQHPGEISQLPEELLNPTMSLLSLLDGMSNSHWVNKLEDEKEQGKCLETRAFAKLFDA